SYSNEVVLIPDGILNLVPFSCLLNERTNKYFMEEYSISVCPSIRLLDILNQQLYIGRLRKQAPSETIENVYGYLISTTKGEKDPEINVVQDWFIGFKAKSY